MRFRKFLELLFCGVLLGWTLLIHGRMVWVISDPIFAPDSGGYVSPAIRSLFGGSFSLDSIRTPIYPMLLYAVLKMTHHFIGVLFVQHVLAMLAGLVAAILYYRHIRPSLAGSTLLFFLTAALPLPVIYAQYVLTENLYSVLMIISLGLIMVSMERRSKWISLAAGLMIGVLVETRPVGIAMVFVLFLSVVLGYQGRKSWERCMYGLGGAAAILLCSASWNYAYRGFFGIDRIGGVSLFCSTVKYLQPIEIEDSSVREKLMPYFKNQADKLNDGEWVYAVPVNDLRRFYTPEELNHVLGRLARTAILNHPIQFLRDRGAISLAYITEYAATPPYYIMPEASYFVYHGILIYAQIVNVEQRAWNLLRHNPKDIEAYFAQLKFVPTGRAKGNLPYVPQSAADFTYPYYKVLRLWKPLMPLIRCTQWLPLIAFLSAFYLLVFCQCRTIVSLILFTIVAHISIYTLAAWQDGPRYTFPILPLYYMLMIAGFQVIMDKIRRVFFVG